MSKEEKGFQPIPETFKLKDKQIECPACGVKIIASFDLDISFLSKLTGAFQDMNKRKKEKKL